MKMMVGDGWFMMGRYEGDDDWQPNNDNGAVWFQANDFGSHDRCLLHVNLSAF